MGYNKFITHSGKVLLDLTADTVTEADVLAGKSFHKADGSEGVGGIVVVDSNTVTVGLDFSEGNMTISLPDGCLAKSAAIEKPQTLLPENIKEGVTVAGIVGTLSEGGDSTDVTLLEADIIPDFSQGDQVVTSEEGIAFQRVILRKPTALIPENIAKDVTIAGVVGTYAGGTVADDRIKYVTFIGGDDSVLYRMPVISGDNCHNPVTKGYISTPTKEDNAQYKDFTFTGWSLTSGGTASSSALSNVTEDRTVYAVFNATVQTYTVNFYDDDGTLLNTQTLEYGATPSYKPLKDYHSFVGWNPAITTVTGNADYYAIWEETAYIAEGTCGDNVSWHITDRYELVLTGTGSTYDYRAGAWTSNSSWSPWYTDHLELITSSITSITVGDGITRLGDGLFYYFRAATEISIPDSVTEFGIGTFSECRSVTSYVIPNGITSFPTRLFDCNVVLESLTIPDGVTSIGNQTFCACYLLRSINVPASVTYISNRGLSNFKSGDKANTGFASIVFEDTKSSWLLKESATATTTAKTIQGSELADPANAAKLFRYPEYESGCYGNYHWFKKS